MKQNIKDILLFKYHKKKELKKELKKKILKSIIQNNFTIQPYRVFAQLKLEKIIKNAKPNRAKRLCLFTGRKRGIINKFNISRHQVKQLNIFGQVQNIKLSSW